MSTHAQSTHATVPSARITYIDGNMRIGGVASADNTSHPAQYE
jgi:hypothetical protein